MMSRAKNGVYEVWVYRLDRGGRLIGTLRLGADIAFSGVYPGDLACASNETCVATIGYGAHSSRAIVVELNNIGMTAGQSIDGFDRSMVVQTPQGLMVGLTARDPNMALSNAAAQRFWKTWTLRGARLVAGGCTGYEAQLGVAQPMGPCPPLTSYQSGLQKNRDPLIDGPVTAGTPATLATYLKFPTTAEFTSPSINIWCEIYATGGSSYANCEIGARRFPVPPRPVSANCLDGFGSVVQVANNGATIPCTDPIDRNGLILPFGSTLVAFGISCLMTRSGVKCLNAEGRGFILSQDELTLL